MPYKNWIQNGNGSKYFTINGKEYLFNIQDDILSISLNRKSVLAMILTGNDDDLGFIDLLF